MGSWVRLALVTTCLSISVYACGGRTNAADTPCEPGATMECPSACPGESVCMPDGSGWTECGCGFGGTGFGGGGYPGGYGGGGYGGGYGGGGYPGGYGGGGYGGGYGGYGAYGGSSFGGSGAVGPCFGECPSYQLGGIIEMSACCTTPDVCGGYISSTIGSIISLSEGCYPTNQPGNFDPSCPSHTFINPIDGSQATYQGCCRATGTCGIDVDLTSAQGPYLGCSDPGNRVAISCGTSPADCNACAQNLCQTEIANCLGEAACSQIVLCTQNCSNAACVDTCIDSSPPSQQFQLVLGCVKQKCFGECQALFQ